MARPEKLIFLCVNERAPGHKESCGAAHDSAAIGAAFKKCLKQRGLSRTIRATTTSCLGPCTGGPHAVVMPDNVWYSGFSVDDVEEILVSHLVGGEPVERLLAPNPDSTHG
jgi:(2Fe-2S) ferredoxin